MKEIILILIIYATYFIIAGGYKKNSDDARIMIAGIFMFMAGMIMAYIEIA